MNETTFKFTTEEKTAIKLINEFGSVEGLIENSSQVKGKLREKVEGAVEDIRMSKISGMRKRGF